MDETSTQRALAILAKPPEKWTRDDNQFIWQLIKKGYKDRLKALRVQVELG